MSWAQGLSFKQMKANLTERRECGNGPILLFSGEATALQICPAVGSPWVRDCGGQGQRAHLGLLGELLLPLKSWCEQVAGRIQKTLNRNQDLSLSRGNTPNSRAEEEVKETV